MVRPAFLDWLPFARRCSSRIVGNELWMRLVVRRLAPVLGRKVVERHERVTILRDEAAGRLVFGSVFSQEVVQAVCRHLQVFSQPNLVKSALRLRLETHRHVVEHVRHLVNPAPLLLSSLGRPP